MSAARQLVLDFPARQAFGRADFYVTPANSLALGQIDAWPDWPQRRLAVTGPAGAGKTHLAHVWAARSGAGITPAAGLQDFARLALAPGAALIVEDVDRITTLPAADAARIEETLFHVVNHLQAGGGSLLLTGRSAPAGWNIRLPDLASRLATAAVARLEPPDDALLSAVLVKLFSDRQLDVPADLIAFLLARMERSLGAAAELVSRLDRAALAQKRPVTVRLASEVLRGDTDAPRAGPD